MLFKRSTGIVMLLAVMFLGLATGPAYAISEGGAIFLLIRPGARPSGMGSAFAAISDDATATYFNPAGLAFLMPDAVQYFQEDDIKDWAVLVSNLQDKDAFYLVQQQDLLDPASIILQAGQSPLLTVSDIADWNKLGEFLRDSTRDGRAYRLVSGWLDSTARAAIFNSDSVMTLQDKWTVLYSLNKQISSDQDIYRRSVLDGMETPPTIRELILTGKYSRDKNELTSRDFADPLGLVQQLVAANDPLSRYLWGRLASRSRAVLKNGLPADSAATILAVEFSKIIKGRLYQPARLANVVLSDALKERSAVGLKGEDLALFNMQLLEAAYPRQISLTIDHRKIGPDNSIKLNRTLLESYLPEIIKPYAQRMGKDSLSLYIVSKIGEPGWESLKKYHGQEAMTPEEETGVLEFMNTVINGYETGEAGQKDNLPALKAKREALEILFPSDLASYRKKIQASPQMHIRSLLAPEFIAICDRYRTNKAVSREDRESMLGGLNQLLANRALYRAEYFKNEDLDPAALGYIQEGVDYLSIEDLTALNRKLLESALPGSLKRKVEPTPHYATMMHSPWLSEIWSDVGDMYYEFIAYAQPVKDWGVFGGNVVFLSEGTNQRIDENEQVLGTFSSYEFSPTLTYANKIYSNLAGGINLKLIYSHLAPFGAPGEQGKGIATTWAVDLGLLYHGPFDGLALGLNVQNIGPKLTYIDAQEADPLSRNVRVGTAYDILDGKYSKLTAAWDFTKTIVDLSPDRPWKEELQDVVHHLGMEYWYLGPASLALRAGYVLDEVGHIKGPTYGAGVGFRKIQFDFAMEPGGDLQNFNKKFSLSAVF
ncbi:MAG: hypothetical protein A2273_06880 [Candidatus Edwardsbacteria bacterium RifOxyA12_full_54_48]|uniref:Type IX secretion system protein PorV domain-containing protein n=1 Tax=Candidatus Edwardsbacteria bacterium GWF2_54_11 TaxID=1817851 RepID=A0A1F5RIG1_9BACT|nr:MAG: hypothetical protein A2502_04500 [Candidatus Edwardsbacteria bacterium RifOxyC12_full_54_24]OGF08655.1 MAG: hypothetical protein A2273_06880 [Candidatus Edwardsbacteria bacterium RifOxyA12_full_54_48]OGF11299.1 MAG: hypothetical protein A3K15_02945 [Candidatus Edwardsbacteria bacterium GWE2_54_12]OGF14154.1 MAG: hypothetical protein A2024_07350 [Candidatus Edwardsbacteria bacterium GWF2_54_11]OGJ18113.1 MAG: hypothetical protein A2349_05335 [Candidatus Edwardsbacteria bacterium RifOxyB1